MVSYSTKNSLIVELFYIMILMIIWCNVIVVEGKLSPLRGACRGCRTKYIVNDIEAHHVNKVSMRSNRKRQFGMIGIHSYLTIVEPFIMVHSSL